MRLTLVLAAALAAPAFASGSTPPLPLPEQRFESYAACLAHLKTVHEQDVKRIDTAPVTREDGSVLQHSLTTQGVVEAGGEAASYSAEYGTTVSVRDAAAGQIKHQYSWERAAYRCDGGALSGETSSGFSSPLFEPAP